MMQTLSKTELRWVIGALEHDMQLDLEAMEEFAPGSVQHCYARLHSDNLKSVIIKLEAVIATDAKRIAVK